jgi:sulfur carrier protein
LQIIVNGKEQIIEGAKTIDELLLALGFERQSVAVALNGTFVARGEYPTTKFEEKMDIEVLVPMQGG